MADASVLASSIQGRGHALHDRALFYYAGFVFAVACLLGGGTAVGQFSDQLVEVVSVPLLFLGLARLMGRRWEPGWAPALSLLGLILALPLLQLVPLPPAIWTLLPGRAAVVEVYQAAGLPIGWRPFSLAPFATFYSFLSLLPAAALFVAALQLETSQRFRLLIAPLAIAALSGLLGVVQVLSRDASSISMQNAANVGYAIGFFANRNHFAALVYVMLPFAIVWTVRGMRGSRDRAWFFGLLFGGAVIASLLVGLSSAFSRAGVALGVVSLLGSAFIVWRSARASRLGRLPVIIASVCLLVFAAVMQLGLVQLLIQRSAVDGSRRSIARLTMEAIQSYSFAGSGFGTFVPIFKSFEQPSDIIVFFINHAHNDYLELALEGGILAVALIAAYFVWYFVRFWAIWLARDDRGTSSQRLLASAASLSIALLLLHSLLDYPLRTITLMVCFAVASAFMIEPPPESEEAPQQRRRRSSRGS